MQVLKRVLVLGIIFSLSFIAVCEAQMPGAEGTENQVTEPAAGVPEAGNEVSLPQALPSVSQEAAVPVSEEVSKSAEPAAEKTAEWVWGEVVSVDKENKQLVIKHLDYDTYEEVQTALKLDDKTLLENVTDLGEIQPRDHVTVDYRVEKGSNLVGLIVVEKPKETTPRTGVETEQAPAETLAPEAALGPVTPQTPADMQAVPEEAVQPQEVVK